MHAMAMKAAKKKALSELIKQMRHMELKGSGDAPKGPVDMTEEEDDVLEPDMSDLEDVEGAVGKEEDDESLDPKAELEKFMKKGGKRPSHSRASVVMEIKSPAQRMKKTFGK